MSSVQFLHLPDEILGEIMLHVSHNENGLATLLNLACCNKQLYDVFEQPSLWVGILRHNFQPSTYVNIELVEYEGGPAAKKLVQDLTSGFGKYERYPTRMTSWTLPQLPLNGKVLPTSSNTLYLQGYVDRANLYDLDAMYEHRFEEHSDSNLPSLQQHQLQQLSSGGSALALDVHVPTTTVAVSVGMGELKLFDAYTGKNTLTVSHPVEWVIKFLCPSSESQLLFTATVKGSAIIDPSTSAKHLNVQTPAPSANLAPTAAVSDGTNVVIAYRDSLRIYDFRFGFYELKHLWEVSQKATSLVANMSLHGDTVVVPNDQGGMRFLDLKQQTCTSVEAGPSWAVDFSPDGRHWACHDKRRQVIAVHETSSNRELAAVAMQDQDTRGLYSYRDTMLCCTYSNKLHLLFPHSS